MSTGAVKLYTILLTIVLACATGPVSAFQVTDTAGQKHRLKALRGKWVVVNFWATWCAPCVKEIPDFAAVHAERGGKDVRVIGIALDVDNAAKTREFAQKHGLTYPLVLGNGKVEKQFGPIEGMPTTLIYNPQGKLTVRKTGVMSKDELLKALSG